MGKYACLLLLAAAAAACNTSEKTSTVEVEEPASAVTEYTPAPGQFINSTDAGFGDRTITTPEEAVAAGLADTVTDNEERTAPSLAGNIARGWERLLAGIGLNRREELPADRNVLLTAGERQELLRRSATAIRQAQQNASPTCTKPREDPSYGDTVRTANQRAYAEDAKRFKGI